MLCQLEKVLLDKIIAKLPKDETYLRNYRAFEGGIRVITADKNGSEIRYAVSIGPKAENIEVRRM